MAWDGVAKNTKKKNFQSINQRVDLELRHVLAYYQYTTQYVFIRYYLCTDVEAWPGVGEGIFSGV